MTNPDPNYQQSNLVTPAITATSFALVVFAVIYAISSVVKLVKGDEPPPPPQIPHYY